MKGNFANVQALAAEVQRINATKEDFKVPTNLISMTDDGRALQLGKFGSMPINDYAHGQIAERVGIPRQYYDAMQQVKGLRATNVNAWFSAKPKTNLVRTLDGNVRAFLSDSFGVRDNILMLGAILPVLEQYPDLQVMSSSLTETRMYLQVAFPTMEVDLSRQLRPGTHQRIDGDVVRYGLTFRNSEVGAGAYDIEKTIWRLVCTNGLIASSVMKKYHVGRKSGELEDINIFRTDTIEAEQRHLLLTTRDVVAASLQPEHFQKLTAKIVDAAGQTISEPTQTIERVTKRFGLSNRQGEFVLNEMMKPENGPTRWGLVNGITALAHLSDNPDQGYEIEKLGSDILDLSPKDWKLLTREAA